MVHFGRGGLMHPTWYNEDMKLALIGADDESLALIRWAVRDGGHELIAAFDLAGRTDDVQTIAPNVRLNEDWESLVLGSAVNAVVIARAGAGLTASTGIPDDERRGEQLRKLAQAAVPMLVFCPACEAIVGFEIEMIRRDVGGVIVPASHVWWDSRTDWMYDLLVAGEQSRIGRIEQVLFERQQVDRSRSAVLAQLSRDVSILRSLLGEIRSVSATGPAPALGRDPLGPKPRELPSLANLSVHLGGNWEPAVRWSISPVVDQEGASLILVGTRGKAMLHMPAHGPWSAEVLGENRPLVLTKDSSLFASMLDRLQKAIERPETVQEEWLGACRDQEVAEAVDRSLARGRTIELFGEGHTEEDSFKGVMSVGGCLLLVMALGVVFIATIVEGLRLPMRDWMIWQYWPIYLLVPVVVFLLLQLLQLVVKRDESSLRQLIQGDGPGN
jgi:hypothetical protein